MGRDQVPGTRQLCYTRKEEFTAFATTAITKVKDDPERIRKAIRRPKLPLPILALNRITQSRRVTRKSYKMNPIFTIQHSEFLFSEYMSRELGKEKYSVLLPINRQQKYFDLVLLRINDRQTRTFQVKSSRSYSLNEREQRRKGCVQTGWFNPIALNEKIDFVVLVVYFALPLVPSGHDHRVSWKEKILVFKNQEAHKYKMDTDKFYIGLDSTAEDLFVYRSVSPSQVNSNISSIWLQRFREF